MFSVPADIWLQDKDGLNFLLTTNFKCAHEKPLVLPVWAKVWLCSPKYFLALWLTVSDAMEKSAGSACSFPFLSSLFPKQLADTNKPLNK